MKLWHALFLLGAVVVVAAPVNGARLYLSALGPGEGATPGNAALSLPMGGSATLHLWAQVSPSERLWVLALDFIATDPAVMEGAGVFQFADFEADFERWSPERNPGIAGDVLTNVRTLAGGGCIGINGRYLDPTYEQDAGFYVGSLQIAATAVGVSSIFLTVDAALIVGPVVDDLYFGTGDARLPSSISDDGQHYLEEGVRSLLADATITVHNPEPGTVALLAFGGLALCRRRLAA